MKLKLFTIILFTLILSGCAKKEETNNPPVLIYHGDFDQFMNAIEKSATDHHGTYSWIAPTGSMEPFITDYDWVIMLGPDLAPFKDLKTGDIVAYRADWIPGGAANVLHRLQGPDNWGGWIIGGDHNAGNDPNTHVTPDNYLGKCIEIYRFKKS